MTDFGWVVTVLVSLFGGVGWLIYHLYNKHGTLNTRVAILEDKDLEAQVKELARKVDDFRVAVISAGEKNFATLIDKLDHLRIEIKGDIKEKADKE